MGRGTFDRHGVPPRDMPKNIAFEVGWFNETLPAFLHAHTRDHVSYVNVDNDLYDGACDILRQLQQRPAAFAPGAILHLHEAIRVPVSRNVRPTCLQEARALFDCWEPVNATAATSSWELVPYRNPNSHRASESVAFRRLS